MNKRLQKIMKKNAKWEKESPYDFCDRWCERCEQEKQKRCKLYQDEFERDLTCIANGREPGDPEVTEEVMRMQYEKAGEFLEERLEELDIDFDALEEPESESIKQHIKFVENNPLQQTADQYLKRAREFLGRTFYKNKGEDPEFSFDFKVVSWYHTLLPVKLNRALAGFHEPAGEDEFALYDAIAQFQICKKAINRSISALRNISQAYTLHRKQITELIALLQNIHSRIVALEESI